MTSTLNYRLGIVDQLDPDQTSALMAASHFAVGTGDADSVASGLLESKVGGNRAIDSFTNNGTSADVTCSLAEGDANGNTIREVGLIDDADNEPICRILLDSDQVFDKTSDISVTLTFTLTVVSL